jgi:hypothetical protein
MARPLERTWPPFGGRRFTFCTSSVPGLINNQHTHTHTHTHTHGTDFWHVTPYSLVKFIGAAPKRQYKSTSLHGVPIHRTVLSIADAVRTLTDWLTTQSRVLVGKLTVPPPAKKFPALYRTRRFITASQQPATSSCPEPHQPSPCPPILFLKDSI